MLSLSALLLIFSLYRREDDISIVMLSMILAAFIGKSYKYFSFRFRAFQIRQKWKAHGVSIDEASWKRRLDRMVIDQDEASPPSS